jgi:hypothetical protein
MNLGLQNGLNVPKNGLPKVLQMTLLNTLLSGKGELARNCTDEPFKLTGQHFSHFFNGRRVLALYFQMRFKGKPGKNQRRDESPGLNRSHIEKQSPFLALMHIAGLLAGTCNSKYPCSKPYRCHVRTCDSRYWCSWPYCRHAAL